VLQKPGQRGQWNFKETFSGISDEGLYETESCSDEMGWTYANNNTKIAPSFSPSYY